MVEAAPAAALVVPEPDFLLEILVVPLDPPAQLSQVDHLLEADLLRQGRQPVLRRLRLALGPLDQQPFLLARRIQPGVGVRGAHPGPGKARGKLAVRALAPRRAAKKRWQAIEYTRGPPKRVPLYRALIKITRTTLTYLRDAAARLSGSAAPAVTLWLAKVCHYEPLVESVIAQSERRVLRGEAVPARDKLVSLFETHADIILGSSPRTRASATSSTVTSST